MRLRGLKSGPGRLVVQLGPDALLDPARLATLVAKGKGRYRLTPGMELVELQPGEQAPAPLEAARSLLQELRKCAVDG
jgi:hypothetical protein